MNKVIVLILLFFSGAIFCTTPSLNSFTYLMKALEDKKSPLEINHMINRGADVNAIHSEFLRLHKSVLRYALDRGTDQESVKIIRMLIDAGADVNGITYNRVTDTLIYGMMPLLTYAAIYSSAEVVQILINAGARDSVLSESSINFQKTALKISQKLGKTETVKVLEKVQLRFRAH